MNYKEKAKKRELESLQRLRGFYDDPFIGYPTLEASLEAYKFTSQAAVLARLLNRENVFISGPAGSGKTTIIERFKHIIETTFGERFSIASTASTGIAATLIGGSTIHSWAGLGVTTAPFNPKDPGKFAFARREQMNLVDVLLIDEISMLPAYVFDNLNATLKWARRNSKPFGGVQLVLMGDFLQLPPVGDRDPEVNSDYAITSKAWKELDISYCFMDKVHRAADKKLKFVLGSISHGRGVSDSRVNQILNLRRGDRATKADPEKTYTTLYTTNMKVDQYNEEQFALNKSPLSVHRIKRAGREKDVDKLIKMNGIPEEVRLKVGAPVILTANTISPVTSVLHANGSIGTIESIIGGLPRVRFNDGEVMTVTPKTYSLTKLTTFKNSVSGEEIKHEETLASVDQLPLKLGYAITVHKSQGQTFDGVVVDLSKCFTPGLGYVALSRVRDLDDLVITDMNNKALLIDERSLKISRFVKRKALDGRADFEGEKKDTYSALLSAEEALPLVWEKSRAESVNRPRK